MAENLTGTFHQNTEIIDETWKEYKETLEGLANSEERGQMLIRIAFNIQNHVNKTVIDLSKNVRNLSRELCRTAKKWWIPCVHFPRI